MAAKLASAPTSRPFKQPSKLRALKPDVDVENTDARFQHISNTVLQKSPYILTVPQDRPFLNRSYGETDWRRVPPFAANEEQLQYMSFHPRDDDDDTVFRVIGGWDNENGELDTDKPSPSQAKSGSSTPATGAPKKKMSLAEYKKQKTAAKDAPKQPVPNTGPDKPRPLENAPNGKPSPKPDGPVQKLDHKRSHGDMVAEESPPVIEPRSDRPEKKQRTSDVQETLSTSSKSTQSDADLFALPPMLSPTLSADLEEEIQKHRARSAAKRNNVHTVNVNSIALGSSSSQEHTAGKAHLAVDSQSRVSKSPAPSSVASDTRVSLVVKLKIPKSRQGEVKKILRLPVQAGKAPTKKEEHALHPPKVRAEAGRDEKAGPTKSRNEKEPSDRSNGHVRVSSNATPSESGGAGAKRHRVSDEAEEPHRKRNKSDLARPTVSTPPINGSSQNSSTPRRDLKASAPARLNHLDGEVKTPKAPLDNSTPLAPPTNHGRTNRDRSESTISPSLHGSMSNNPEVQAWANERRKLLALGKRLKHEADRLCHSSDAAKHDTALLKTAIATVVETIICYILCFTVMDQEKRASKMPVLLDSWLTTTRFIDWRARFTGTCDRPLLNGLCLQLEAVSRGRLHAVYGHHLEAWTGPLEDVAPAALMHDGELPPKKFMEFKNSMAENARMLQQRWVEATGKLTIDDLMTSFPKTWAQRAKVPLGRLSEKMRPGAYGGGFYLPLGMHSKEIEAVRAGWAILNEWVGQEKVQWKGRLPL